MKASVKYRVIHRFKGKYNVRDMCIFFRVSRSGYYTWTRKANKEQKERSRQSCNSTVTKAFPTLQRGFFKLTTSHHTAPSMSSPGNPPDNACAENFFSTPKSEWFHRYTPATKEVASLLLDEYMHFYNYERIQPKTKLTPYEKRCQFQEIPSCEE